MKNFITAIGRVNLAVKHGHSSLIIREFFRRIYSEEFHYGMRRDINTAIATPEPKIPVQLHLLQEKHLTMLLDLEEKNITDKEFKDRLYRLSLVRANFRRCYVAVTKDGKPCHMHWLLKPSDNDKIRSYFKGGFQQLAPSEVLFEGVYTIPPYRGQGLMPYVMSLIIDENREKGVRWAMGFVQQTNVSSIKAMNRAGFEPFLLRRDLWRFFRRRVSFQTLSNNVIQP